MILTIRKKLLEDGKKIIILDHHEIDNQEEIEDMGKECPNSYALVNNVLDKKWLCESSFCRCWEWSISFARR